MQRASQKHPVPGHTGRAAPSAPSARSGSVFNVRETYAAGEPDSGSPSRATLDSGAVHGRETAATEVLLTSAGAFVGERQGAADPCISRKRQLAIAIRQRIESRLAGRVRNLAVRIIGRTIILEGQCSTYYSKQLAQHAALGVIQDEQLENAIVVAVPR
jgi:hypothetical protein